MLNSKVCMMCMILCLTILGLQACKFETSSSNTQVLSRTPSKARTASKGKLDLLGTWNGPCRAFTPQSDMDKDGNLIEKPPKPGMKIRIQFKADFTAEINPEFYGPDDKNCTKPLYYKIIHVKWSIGSKSKTVLGAYEINTSTIDGYRVILDEDALVNVNRAGICEKSDWKLGEKVTSCFQAGVQHFGIFKIDDKKLRIGKNSGKKTGKTANQRQVELDDYAFLKQDF